MTLFQKPIQILQNKETKHDPPLTYDKKKAVHGIINLLYKANWLYEMAKLPLYKWRAV